jgi:hypothetical protein
VTAIARALDVPEQDVVSMNRRLTAPDFSLNVAVGEDQENEWQDWLADERADPETAFAEQEQTASRSALLANALETLKERERIILTERRLRDEPQTLEELSQHYGILASGCARSKYVPSRKCNGLCRRSWRSERCNRQQRIVHRVCAWLPPPEPARQPDLVEATSNRLRISVLQHTTERAAAGKCRCRSFILLAVPPRRDPSRGLPARP